MTEKFSHYVKDVSCLKKIDVYRVLELFEVTSPAIQHAVKKLLAAGKRGTKDADRDVQEAIQSLQRWQEMREEDECDLVELNLSNMVLVDPSQAINPAIIPENQVNFTFETEESKDEPKILQHSDEFGSVFWIIEHKGEAIKVPFTSETCKFYNKCTAERVARQLKGVSQNSA